MRSLHLLLCLSFTSTITSTSQLGSTNGTGHLNLIPVFRRHARGVCPTEALIQAVGNHPLPGYLCGLAAAYVPPVGLVAVASDFSLRCDYQYVPKDPSLPCDHVGTFCCQDVRFVKQNQDIKILETKYVHDFECVTKDRNTDPNLCPKCTCGVAADQCTPCPAIVPCDQRKSPVCETRSTDGKWTCLHWMALALCILYSVAVLLFWTILAYFYTIYHLAKVDTTTNKTSTSVSARMENLHENDPPKSGYDVQGNRKGKPPDSLISVWKNFARAGGFNKMRNADDSHRRMKSPPVKSTAKSPKAPVGKARPPKAPKTVADYKTKTPSDFGTTNGKENGTATGTPPTFHRTAITSTAYSLKVGGDGIGLQAHPSKTSAKN